MPKNTEIAQRLYKISWTWSTWLWKRPKAIWITCTTFWKTAIAVYANIWKRRLAYGGEVDEVGWTMMTTTKLFQPQALVGNMNMYEAQLKPTKTAKLVTVFAPGGGGGVNVVALDPNFK